MTCYQPTDIETINFEIEENDRLKFISGFYSDGIDYIRLESENGVIV